MMLVLFRRLLLPYTSPSSLLALKFKSAFSGSTGEFRWKISLAEDLEPLVVLVCHLHWKLRTRRLCPLLPSAGYANYSYPNTVLPRIIAAGSIISLFASKGGDYSRGAVISNIAHLKSCPKYFVLLSHEIKKLSHQIN